MKTTIIFLFSFLFSLLYANQNPFILTDDNLVDPRAQEKIFEIGNESKSKLNANFYIHIQENNGIDIKAPRDVRRALMQQKDAQIVKDLEAPYAVLVIAIDQLYTNVLISDDLKESIDKDDLLDNYVIPLLASKDKNTLFAKTSAAVLNGYAQMADSLAKTKNITLQSSIGSEGKTAGTIWKAFMYTLVVTGIVLYVIIIMRERKYTKGSKNAK